MVNAFFCEQDHLFRTEAIFEQNKTFYSFVFLMNIHFLEWILCGICDLSLKKQIRKFRRMDLHHQKGKQASERCIDHSEGWHIQKTLSRRVAIRKLLLMKYLTFKASSTWCKDQIQKVKCDVTRSKRSANKSEKLVNHQTVIFPLLWYFQMLRKESNFFSI